MNRALQIQGSLRALLALLLFFSLSCDSGKQTPESSEALKVEKQLPEPPRVTEERRDLFYRYKEPSGGAYTTTNMIGEIPEASRQEVVVYDPSNDVPGWFFVADLRKAQADGSYSCEARPASQMGGKARVSNAETRSQKTLQKTVRFYTASWCGVCTKARRFLKKERIPFVEKDIEKDPSARGELERAAKKAGVPASRLNGVPIFVIGHELISGFDGRRIKELSR